jgi:aminopeptidase N
MCTPRRGVLGGGHWPVAPIAAAAIAAACAPPLTAPQPARAREPAAHAERDIVEIALAIDVTTLVGTAAITFAPSAEPGATLDVGDLAIARVSSGGAPLAHTRDAPGRLQLALPAARAPLTVVIEYRARPHELMGASTRGYTQTWPYHCGNLFPCQPDPADGATFTLQLSGIPPGQVAIAPDRLAEAPAYQLAWAVGDYAELALGTTAAGTALSVWHAPAAASTARAGTAHLVAAFDWLERTIGPYRFGPRAGSVAVPWGPGGLGGMEHHPFWHVGTAALADVETHIHEAAHGWFGGGVRLRCWEDFVLSEGTATYLAARALDAVAPVEGAALWARYARQLAGVRPDAPVWPATCGAIDVIKDGLFTRAPYLRGAFLLRAIALRVGADRLDAALAAFYRARAGSAATMRQLLDTIHEVTGLDPTACATAWLRTAAIPAIAPCPGAPPPRA